MNRQVFIKYFSNIITNNKVKCISLISLLLCIYIFISAYTYVQAVSTDIADNVFRLHVIANSDSEEDQNLKYLVRDGLLQYMNSISSNCKSKSEVIDLAQIHKDDFKNVALDIIHSNGFDYDVNINIGNFEFPTKTYGDIAFPAGFYDALRVEIGDANGKNWWCVMFPPLCFIDVTSGVVPDDSKKELESNLSSEEYAIVSDDSSADIKFKFKLLEFFTEKGLITAKN